MSLRGMVARWTNQEVARLSGEVAHLKASMSNASGSIRFTGWKGSAPRRGTRELLRAYSESPWLQAICRRVGDSVAGVEWRAFRQTRRSRMPEGAAAQRLSRIGSAEKRSAVRAQLVKQAELEPVEVHPILEFLDRGTGAVTLNGHDVRALAQISLDLVGDSFGIVETNGAGVPLEWWPIPANWIESAPRPGQKYEFKVQVPGGPRTTLPGENVIWISDRDPRDPYGLGVGIGRALSDEIDTDEFVSKFVKNTFLNDATPSMLIFAEGLTPDATAALEEKWLQKLQGIFKGKLPFFVSKEVKVQQLQRTFEELQLISQREWNRDVCLQVFGIPPEIMGVIENSNRSTIDSSDYLYSRHVVLPRAERQRAAIQSQIVPKFKDPTLIVDFESPVSEDREHKRQVYAQSQWAFSVDEHRALAGDDELEGDAGRVFPSPLGLMSSEEPLGADLQEIGDEEPPEEDADPDPDPDEGKAAPARVAKRELTESEIQQVLRAISGDEMAAELTQASFEALIALGQSTIDDLGLGIRFNEASPRVIEFLRHEGGTRAVRITQTTRRQIRLSLVQGSRDGDSFDQLSARINRVFDFADRNRSRSIARTESVRASNFGALEGMQQGGIERKQWLSTRGDDRTRDAHAVGSGLDGVTIPIGQEFVDPMNGSRGMHPGDFPEAASSINCRCTLLSVLDEDESAATTPEAKAHHWKRHEVRRARYEGQMVRGVRKAFRRQRASARAALEAIR